MRSFLIALLFLPAMESRAQLAAKLSPMVDVKKDSHKRHSYPTPPKTDRMLFYIQRSTNPSAIVYDGIEDNKGQLKEDYPVDVYWMSYNSDSLRNELNFLQRKFAYGVNIHPGPKPDEYEMTVVSYKKRRIHIFKNDKGEMQANMLIAGKAARFRNAYIEVTENLFWPEVAYAEVFGEDLETGQPVYERITP